MVIVLIGICFGAILWCAVIYPFKGSAQATIPNQIPFSSIIPTSQSGMTQFNLPLPIQGWNLPITIICTIENLTNAGICQNAPVEINVTLTIQNGAQLGVANEYISISWFMVQPANAIEVSYTPNWNLGIYPVPWSYQPDNPAQFSSLICWNTTNLIPQNETLSSFFQENEAFSSTQDVILQDSGILNLQVQPTIFSQDNNITDWQNTQYYPDYYNYTANVNIPISIISQTDANQQLLQQQAQIQQYNFNKVQAQLSEDQKTETVRGTSLTLFIIGFASLDIGITLYPFSKEEEKEAGYKQRKTQKGQAKILKWIEKEAIE